MKKLLYVICPIIIAGLVASCTLMMDDFSVPEEERGIEEPYTQETPYGNVTYQYQPDVTPLNGDVQKYIMMIDHDSIIYLSDAIPEKWIPKVGGHVAANCTRTTPLGLCGTVLSVTRQDGMIKVVTTHAEQSEVYKVMKINIDFDYDVPQREVYDSLEMDSMGIDITAEREIDMTMFDKYEAAEKGDTTQLATRADGVQDTTIIFTYSKSYKRITCNVTYKSNEHKRVHVFEDSDRDYREEWTDSWADKHIEVEIGYGNDVDKGGKGIQDITSTGMMKEYLEYAKQNIDKKAPWRDTSKKLLSKKLTIPIPMTPIALHMECEGKFYIDAHGFIKLLWSYETDTRRLGYIMNDGDKKKIDEVIKEGSDTQFDGKVGGSVELYVRGRLGVGVMLGNQVAGIGGVVGIEVKAGIKGMFESNPIFATEDYIDYENMSLEAYCNFGAYAKGIVRFLIWSFDLGEVNFATKTFSSKVPLSASIDDDMVKKTYKIVDYQPNEDEPVQQVMQFNVSYAFDHLGLAWSPYTFYMKRPAIRIYSGELTDKKFVTIINNDMDRLEQYKLYNFTIHQAKDNVTPAEEYHVIPCMYDTHEKSITEFRNHDIVYGSAAPRILKTHIYQSVGEDMSADDIDSFESYLEENKKGLYGTGQSINHKLMAHYSVSIMSELKYAHTIKEWGYTIKIKNKNDKVLLQKTVRFDYNVNIWSSGKYTLIVDFISNCKPETDKDNLTIEAKPYITYQLEGKTSTQEFPKDYISLKYPYRREGGPYLKGKVSSANLNVDDTDLNVSQ